MPERPKCLDRRCKVLDDLVQDLNTAGPACPRCDSPLTEKSSCDNNEVGIKLMCDFWKILQEDPECNLSQEVQQRMCVDNCSGRCKREQEVYTSKESCSKNLRINSPKGEPKRGKKHNCCASASDTMPLQKALGSLKEAASFEKKCNVKVGELAYAQKELVGQIQILERKEKKGAALLKQADSMWSSMEETYKRTLAASNERCQVLQKQLQQIEASSNKWRKTKKELEFKLKNADHNADVINQRINQKTNDITAMNLEIEDFKKRIETNKKDMEATQNAYKSKKEASDARLEKIATHMTTFQDRVVSECKCKADKEQEGGEYVKDAREDLQKLCRCLLQKKLENEDLRAEKEALLLELDLLKTTWDTCAVRCAKREKNIAEESKKMDEEIEGYTTKCVQCHRGTDSSDIKNICIDCPRCLKDRDCLFRGDHCDPDPTTECVCSRIKEKFLDNVFDNMYSVLEKESKTCSGKELADCILNCLKRSRNGKLDADTRKILQEFILSTVKKNLNLTIVGGAVKTRCEMDPETYKQLMLCLKDVTITPPVKEDKGTVSKKPPCSRWNDTSECNCPKGPKDCPCSKRAPKPPTDPTPCGPTAPPKKHEPDKSVKICPKREGLACGTDCGMKGLPGAKELKREPCESLSCPFSNMRAAQCTLGPENLAFVRSQNSGSKGPPANTFGKGSTPPPGPRKGRCINGSKEVKACQTEVELKSDAVTRANYKKITEENRNLHTPLTDAALQQSDSSPVFCLKKDIMLGGQIQKNIIEELNKRDLNQYDTKERFKLLIENDQSSGQFAELTLTRSGNLAFNLDDQAIKLIEERSIADPHLAMSIKTTSSGHLLVDLDKKESLTDKTHKVKVRRTSSGTLLLDIHKNMIKILKGTLLHQRSNSDLSKSNKFPPDPKGPKSQMHTGSKNIEYDKDETGEPDISQKGSTEPTTANNNIENILAPVTTKLLKLGRKEALKPAGAETSTNSDCCKVKSYTDCKNCTNFVLQDFIKNTITDKHALLNNEQTEVPTCSYAKTNTSSISCKLLTELDSPQEWLTINHWKSCTTTNVSVTDSNFISEFKKLYEQSCKNVAVDIQEKNGVVWKLSTIVTKTKSSTIAMYARDMSTFKEIPSNGKEYPVLLSKTISGTYFVSIGNHDENFNATLKKTPSEGMLLIPKSFQERKRKEDKDYYKVKLAIMTNQSLELPAVLKTTSSENYLVVLDKEFESHYKAIINKYFADKREGSIDLQTTSSGNFVIELGNEDESRAVKKNALLVKSRSGNIKVRVRKPAFESMAQLELTCSSTSLAQASVRIDSNLPASSRDFHRENLIKSKNLDGSKVSSDIKLFEKVKVTIHDIGPTKPQPSVLTKTASGKLAVVLDKELKTIPIDNAEGTLKNNAEGCITIKRLDSDEIIIDLKNTLKMTPSGQIYVEDVVDEKAVTSTAKSPTTNVALSASSTRPAHVTRLIDSVISSIPTTYQLKSEECCCDTPTCVCNEFQFDTIDGSNDRLTKQVSSCMWKKANACKDNTEKCSGAPELEISRDEVPLIVIKPMNDSDSMEQCYFWVSSSCTTPQFSYVGMGTSQSSEIPESGKSHGRRSVKKLSFAEDLAQGAGQNSREVWDTYCNFLPPQLPDFLKDIIQRSDSQ